MTLPLATSSPILTLVGLGVRTVSFLRVKVYSAGFYLQENATKSLDSIPGWHVSAESILEKHTADGPDIHRPAPPDATYEPFIPDSRPAALGRSVDPKSAGAARGMRGPDRCAHPSLLVWS